MLAAPTTSVSSQVLSPSTKTSLDRLGHGHKAATTPSRPLICAIHDPPRSPPRPQGRPHPLAQKDGGARKAKSCRGHSTSVYRFVVRGNFSFVGEMGAGLIGGHARPPVEGQFCRPDSAIRCLACSQPAPGRGKRGRRETPGATAKAVEVAQLVSRCL